MTIKRVHDLPKVGNILAGRILKKLGGPSRSHGQALAAIKNDHTALHDIQGISPGIAEQIRAALDKHDLHADMSTEEGRARDFIDSFNLSDRQTNLIIETLGLPPYASSSDNEKPKPSALLARKRITQNPYILLEVPTLRYNQVENIANGHFHIPIDDPTRNYHANQFILRQHQGVMSLSRYNDARAEKGYPYEHRNQGVILDRGRAWLTEEHEAEIAITTWAKNSLTQTTEPEPITERDEQVMREYGLNPEQQGFIRTALTNKTTTLSGGAGTGKSFTLAALIDVSQRKGLNTHVLTLAGKSAERVAQICRQQDIPLTESNQYGLTEEHEGQHTQAQGLVYITTVHRGLRSNARGEFSIIELAADLIIIDEASMIPNGLLAEIISRAKPTARFVLAGDPAQLPPITYGAPFDDLLTFKRLPHVHLTQNYRQAAQESIHQFATSLRERSPRMPFLKAPGLTLHFDTQPGQGVSIVMDYLTQNPQSLLHWQVITSTNITRTMLNNELQALLNPNGERLAIVKDRSTSTLRAGDKIVVIRNDYDSGIMNGQTGLLLGEGDAPNTLRALIENNEIDLPLRTVESSIRLGYAITVHKAQGSGWPTVFSIETQPRGYNINRLHYTAVTRAERHMKFITSCNKETWWQILTQPVPPRRSSLLSRLQELQP